MHARLWSQYSGYRTRMREQPQPNQPIPDSWEAEFPTSSPTTRSWRLHPFSEATVGLKHGISWQLAIKMSLQCHRSSEDTKNCLFLSWYSLMYCAMSVLLRPRVSVPTYIKLIYSFEEL